MHMFLFNIGCTGHHIKSSLSEHHGDVRKYVLFQKGGGIAVFFFLFVFFNVNVMKIKRRPTKACKKKNLSHVRYGKTNFPSSHSLASLG